MLEIIKRTGVFLIMAETLYQFVQENRYARYVRLLIRLMTLAILLLPILDLIKSGSSELFFQRIEVLESEYADFVEGDTQTEATANMEDILAEYDHVQNITVHTETNIKDTCNKCVMDNGYRILNVSVTEAGIYFQLQPLSHENSVNTQKDAAGTSETVTTADPESAPDSDYVPEAPVGADIQIEPIRSIDAIQITDSITDFGHMQTDFTEEEERMRQLLADHLSITDSMIEVQIDG